jgi:hypothetical protein
MVFLPVYLPATFYTVMLFPVLYKGLPERKRLAASREKV